MIAAETIERWLEYLTDIEHDQRVPMILQFNARVIRRELTRQACGPVEVATLNEVACGPIDDLPSINDVQGILRPSSAGDAP